MPSNKRLIVAFQKAVIFAIFPPNPIYIMKGDLGLKEKSGKGRKIPETKGQIGIGLLNETVDNGTEDRPQAAV